MSHEEPISLESKRPQPEENEEDFCSKYMSSFQLGQDIGQGTFSKVRIAKHRITNEQVAIKIIDKSKI